MMVDAASYDSIRTNNEEDSQQVSFKPISITSIDELRDEMNKIGSNINTIETGWKIRVSSIETIGGMISGGILNKFGDEFISLLYYFRDGICKQITELRSGVTKEIFRVLSYLAISIDELSSIYSLKQQSQSFMDYIIPYILKQTKQTILVISHHSNITLRTIIKRIPISKSIHHIIQNTNINQQKSICLRVRCIEYLQIIIEIQKYHKYYLQSMDNDYISSIIETIINCISDPHPSVRFVARHCVWSLNQIYPKKNYQQYILSKISTQNQKYVISEKKQYKMLPPPIGTGHKIELGMKNKGLINNINNINNNNNNNKHGHYKQHHNNNNRPKSALPSRKHRLELLKKKKKEMAAKLRKQQNNNKNNKNHDVILFTQRPKTAHPPIINQIGQPHRIQNDLNINNNNNNNNDDDDDDDEDEDVIMKGDENTNNNNNNNNNNHRMRKISIMGNATRYSANNSASPQSQIHSKKLRLSAAMRIETHSHVATINNIHQHTLNLDDIITAIHDIKINGINDLSKWLQSNKCNDINNISSILLSLSGFLDSITMNKRNNNDHYVESMVFCINTLILNASSNITIQQILRLLCKLLKLFITSNVIEYENKYNEYNEYFQVITKSLISTQCDKFSLKSLINNLSQIIIKPKQKLIWLHFLSTYCKQLEINNNNNNNNKNKWNLELLSYLFNLLKDCIMNTSFIEYHSLFRCSNCTIIDDIIKYIIYHHQNEYNNIFKTQLNDTTIETLLGIIKNEYVIQILQKYYCMDSNVILNSNTNRNNENMNNNNYKCTTFMTPSHQNKRYQRIRKAQIESMTTPPLNMYITTPAPIINNKYNNNDDDDQNEKENDILRHLNFNQMNDEQLINILLNKQIKSVLDKKNALKYLSHRINGNKPIFNEKCKDILIYIINIMNNDEFILHRNALRIVQAICWFYPKCINQHLEIVLFGIINLFRPSAPTESGELALDVITQFTKIVNYKLCINYLLPIIKNQINDKGRKIFAALSIFDRIIVLSPIDWLKNEINEFTKILIETYKYHREAMRSLIYLSIILNGDITFLNQYCKEQKIVQMMSKEKDFTDWVQSHRIQQYKQ